MTRFCDRPLLPARGGIQSIGDPRDVIDALRGRRAIAGVASDQRA